MRATLTVVCVSFSLAPEWDDKSKGNESEKKTTNEITIPEMTTESQ